ncbi:MAG: LacI family transcriptional regulator [Tannerella sp.]|jgi:LacI family transcriptional regulator|nr:LacI family transcriptional regulator [Tannerella sp.]
MRLSLKDIAKALNVSKTTVSWVLAGQGDKRKISLSTQEKVLAYARKVNYQPNLLARSLTNGSSFTLGLVIPSIGDEFYAHIAREIEMEAEKYNYSLTFCSSEADPERESKIIRMLKSKRVDGLIIAPTKHSRKELDILIEEKYPFVLIDRYFPELDTNYIILDNEGSSHRLVTRLIRDGRKKIALITSDTHLLVMNLRRDGYRRALSEAGLPVIPALYGEVKRSEYETDIVRVLDGIFAEVPDVDGFYFATHYLAMEALRYFYRNGVDITAKVGLACLHTMSSFEILAPRMYIVEQPIRDIGQQAVQILVSELENADDSKKMQTKKKLVLPAIMNFS